jgi:CopA family copper-resistance protein
MLHFRLAFLVFSLGAAAVPSTAPAKTVSYDLTLSAKTVNYAGKSRQSMAINDSIPGPTLRFTEGDDAILRVRNDLKEDSSIHWHGLLVPNDQDGVPHVTMAPIKPGETREYRFRLRQSGTFWYHSHSALQEQLGIYGGIVITPKGGERIKTDHDLAMVLSDWTNERPYDVLGQLRAGQDWQQIKKGTAQSIVGALQRNAWTDMFKRSMSRMPPMDLSDVGYDAFLANGRPAMEFAARPGSTVRVRLINASSASYYHIEYAVGKVKIIAADGTEVQPVSTGRFLMAIAETYDLLVQVPVGGGSWELRATAQDGTGHSSIFIGQGEKHYAPDVPKPNLYKNTMMGGMAGMQGMKDGSGLEQGTMADMGQGNLSAPSPPMNHAGMDGNPGMKSMDGMPGMKSMDGNPGMKSMDGMPGMKSMDGMPGMKSLNNSAMPMPPQQAASNEMEAMPRKVGMKPMGAMSPGKEDPERPGSPYDMLRALRSTEISDARPLREYTFRLQGNMIRFVWTVGGKSFTEAETINVRRGEKVRFTFVNETMMHHPMHLHGHFFRLVTAAGSLSPMKHTADVPPMTSRTIEFAADEPGDWIMHCHMLYHMEVGMARVVHYEDAPEPGYYTRHPMHPSPFFGGVHDPNLFFGQGVLLSQMTEGYASWQNNRNGLMAHWQSRIGNGKRTEYELGLDYDRFINRYLSTFASYEFSTGINRNRGMFGTRYMLPFLVQSQASVDTDGDFRFTLSKSFPITARLSVYGRAQYDTKAHWEITAGAEYYLHKNLSIVAQYHNQYGTGIGLGFRF